jgi:hypothetical protein
MFFMIWDVFFGYSRNVGEWILMYVDENWMGQEKV